MKVQHSFFFIFLLFFGSGIAFYMRFILHDGTVWAMDEGNYLEIITKIQDGQKFSISGPLYIWVIEQFQWLLNASLIYSHTLYALISASVLPVCFFLFYYQTVEYKPGTLDFGSGDNALFAFICVLMLLTSSYFIWSMIEGRPQQLGSLLMVVVLYLYYRQLLNASFFQLVVLILLSSVLFYYHLLSFIFLLVLLRYFGSGYILTNNVLF